MRGESHKEKVSGAKYFSGRLYTSWKNVELIARRRQKHLEEEWLEDLESITWRPGHARVYFVVVRY